MQLKIKKGRFGFLLLVLSSLMIIGVSAAIYYQISASMTIQAQVSPVVFTNGTDTSTCGGSLSTNATQVTFTSIPLAVESDITITQLVNITNTDDSDHSVQISVSSESFGSELTSLKLYLVSPSGAETLVVELDNSGDVITENVSVNIPQGQEWAIKLVGHYDSGTQSQSDTMTLNLQVTG